MNAEGGTANTSELKVALGVYDWVTGGAYTTMIMRITGPNTYSEESSVGKFHIEPQGKIVFETGPLSKFSSKLLSGGRIGLKLDGGTFYNVSCELNRNLH